MLLKHDARLEYAREGSGGRNRDARPVTARAAQAQEFLYAARVKYGR
jgi:hypothetical protein